MVKGSLLDNCSIGMSGSVRKRCTDKVRIPISIFIFIKHSLEHSFLDLPLITLNTLNATCHLKGCVDQESGPFFFFFFFLVFKKNVFASLCSFICLQAVYQLSGPED